jgi:hypothetical protein
MPKPITPAKPEWEIFKVPALYRLSVSFECPLVKIRLAPKTVDI